jgi:hypothetical protein
VSEFAQAIKAARAAAPPPGRSLDPLGLDEGSEVQLSVRVPEGLRTAVASTAAARRMTVTAFVESALRRAVTDANDSFAGLATELARRVRAEIRSAIDDGTYRDIADAVGREEAWS